MNIHLVTGTANPVYIQLFRQSLKKYTDHPYSLHIIADNGVKVEPLDPPMGGMCKELTITDLGPGFHGVGHNWNLGIDLALKGGADWIGIINDDVMFSQQWLSRLVEYLQHTDSRVGVVSPIWHWRGVHSVEHLSPVEAWKWSEGWLDNYSNHAFAYGQQHAKETDRGIQGCFFFLRASAIKDLAQFEATIEPHPGKFDETTFFANWEDNDLAMRLNRAGYTMEITHSVALHHFGSQTVARPDVKQQTGDFYKAGLPKFLNKWNLQHLAGKQFMVHNSIFIVGKEEYPSF